MSDEEEAESLEAASKALALVERLKKAIGTEGFYEDIVVISLTKYDIGQIIAAFYVALGIVET
jgi:hypothetical protein